MWLSEATVRNAKLKLKLERIFQCGQSLSARGAGKSREASLRQRAYLIHAGGNSPRTDAPVEAFIDLVRDGDGKLFHVSNVMCVGSGFNKKGRSRAAPPFLIRAISLISLEIHIASLDRLAPIQTSKNDGRFDGFP